MLHNETVNVWSHIIGVLIFIGILFWTAFGLDPIVNLFHKNNKVNHMSVSNRLMSRASSERELVYLFQDYLNARIDECVIGEDQV